MGKTKDISTEEHKAIPEINIPSVGLGTYRTSSTYIAILLQAEDEGARLRILVEMAQMFGMTLEDITAMYNDEICSTCGMSMFLHKDNNGECF